ncbi:MAG TPA: hypothetical protein PLE30_04140 [Candidatus Kapabacteria bacterium]|nr:hypothetical protein [Candidatus Kapabacteria bacterium]
MVCKGNILRGLLLAIIVYLLSSYNLFAQNKISNISVNPLNRSYISFQTLPINFISAINKDKNQVTITINEPFEYLDTSLIYNGIINKVVINSNSKHCLITLFLNDKRGYSIASLPYSKSLMTEVFQWNSLNNGEDKYRTALLAIESKIPDTSYTNLITALRENTPEVATILGIELIKDSLVKSAQKVLEYAESIGDTTIPDIFAAMSDIYNYLGNSTKRDLYKNKFLKFYPDPNFPYFLSSINNNRDLSIIQKLLFIDTLSKRATIIPIDTSQTDSNHLKTPKSLIASKSESKSPIIEYALYILFAILLLVAFFYMKWRNNKIQEIIETKKIKIPEKKNVQKSQEVEDKKPQPSNLAKIYTKQESNNKQKSSSSEKSIELEAEQIKQQEAKTKTLLDIVKKVQDEKNDKPKTIEEEVEVKNEPSHISMPAKIEMAMNIAKEQKKFKEQSLEEFNSISLPTDVEKLNEISKKLGIEKSGIELRKHMESIMDNNKEIEKLKDKFTNRQE